MLGPYKLNEFTIDDFRKYVSAKTKKFRRLRKQEKGKEATVARFIDFDFDTNTLTILTEPTYNFNARTLPDGSNGNFIKKDNVYTVDIQFVDLDKWKDKPWNEIKLQDFKEIIKVADIKLNCSCFAFFWQGHRFELTTLDSAIYPYSGKDSGLWRNNVGGFNGHGGQAGMCKHLAAIMPLLNFQAPAILKAIRQAAKEKKITV